MSVFSLNIEPPHHLLWSSPEAAYRIQLHLADHQNQTNAYTRSAVMSDFKGLFQTVAVFVAFILTLLCLFSGTQRNFLDDVDILTVSPTVSKYSLEVAGRVRRLTRPPLSI